MARSAVTSHVGAEPDSWFCPLQHYLTGLSPAYPCAIPGHADPINACNVRCKMYVSVYNLHQAEQPYTATSRSCNQRPILNLLRLDASFMQPCMHRHPLPSL